jgi:PAS domain S-box-containing protein
LLSPEYNELNVTLAPEQLYQLLLQGTTARAVLCCPGFTIGFISNRFRERFRIPDGTETIADHLFTIAGDPLPARFTQVLASGAGQTVFIEPAEGSPAFLRIERLNTGPDAALLLEETELPILAGDNEGADSETEQRLRSVIDSTPFPLAVYIGREMRVAYANRSLMDVWGKGYDIIGKTYYELLPELRSQGVYEILDGVFTSGTPYNVRNQRIDLRVDGLMKTSFFNYSFTPLMDASGTVYGVLNTAADVTDSNVARQMLEESELFAKSIIENSPVAKMVLTGEDMIITTVNGNMLEMIGRDRSIIGKSFIDALPELIDSPVILRMKHVLATGETYEEPEGRLEFLKYGAPYAGYFNYIYKALPNTSGEIYGIIITATEVTNLVLTRKRIEETQAALQGAIELAELATWSYHFRSGALNYSRRMREWHGLEPDAEVSFDTLLDQVPEAEKNEVRDSFKRLQEPGGIRNFDEEYSIRNLQTGAFHIIHVQGRLTLDDEGRPLKWSGAANEVTQQRKARLALEQLVKQRTEELAASNEELQTANEELADVNTNLIHSNEELAQYAYVASHDLQEPLRKIRLFSGMLQEKLGDDPDASPLVVRIGKSATRMHQLIRDLLDFSRLLKSDELVMQVDLNEIVNAVCNDFELSIAEKGAEIFTEPLPVIEAVNLQMNQLFYNLIGNAIKFNAPERQPRVRISARALAPADLKRHINRPIPETTYYDISIADNGIGLEPQYAEQIFEVFKRLHTRDTFPGSGIGLALCRRIVNNHTGNLYVESAPGAGSTFHILLPEKQSALPAEVG